MTEITSDLAKESKDRPDDICRDNIAGPNGTELRLKIWCIQMILWLDLGQQRKQSVSKMEVIKKYL